MFFERGQTGRGTEGQKRKDMGIGQWHWVNGEAAATGKGDQKSLVGACRML